MIIRWLLNFPNIGGDVILITRFDKFGNIEKPQLVLMELSRERLGIINALNVTASFRWTNISEISFFVPSIDLDGNPSEIYDMIQELRLIEMLPGYGYFQIRDISTVSDGIREIKNVRAYSVQVMLQYKQVINLEGEFKLYDPVRPYESVMGVLLPQIPGWRIRNVDSALLTKWRSLNITKQNLYALLTNDLSNIYECIFVFDYLKQEIDIHDVSKNFRPTSIYMSYENLVKSSEIKTKTENIITALHVKGGNAELDIAGVNPNGTDTIYNLWYYKDRMSPGLLSALNAYESRYASLQPIYANWLLQLRHRNVELLALRNNPPQYDVSFNSEHDGTAQIVPPLNNNSGLSQLEAVRSALENIRSVRIEKGNIPYSDVNSLINQVEPMLTAKKNAITAKETEITGINTQLRSIVDQLKMENNFTDAQWIELNQYFIFDFHQEDSLIWTDIMTHEERQGIQQELFDLGARALQRSSYPKFEITISSINFLALQEFQYFTDQFELGTTFTLNLDHYKVQPLLLEVNIDFDNLTNFGLKYANRAMLDDGFSLVDFAGNNVNATNTISFDLVRLEAMKRQSDDVTAFINGALDASRNELISSPTRTAIVIDETGLRARSYDWDTGGLLNTEAWLTGSQLAFSSDNFQSSRLALGRIHAPGSTGGQVYGLVADVIAGRLMAGNELHISNNQNNFILNEHGAFLNNANFIITRTEGGITNRIVLDPTEGFSIWRGGERQIYLDSNGNAVFQGQIVGGSININNRFMVNNNGDMTATSAYIVGTVDASNIHGSTLWGGSIIGSYLNIGNGNAEIHTNGIGYFRDIHITGGTQNIGQFNTGGTGFRVDADGTIWARNGNFTGRITASEIGTSKLMAPVIEGGNITGITIRGAEIYGGRYWNLGEGAYITVGNQTGGGNAADFGLYRSNGNLTFNVEDRFGTFALKYNQSSLLESSGNFTHAYGTWNFSNAFVTGMRMNLMAHQHSSSDNEWFVSDVWLAGEDDLVVTFGIGSWFRHTHDVY